MSTRVPTADQLPEGVLELDSKQRISYVNGAACRLLQIPDSSTIAGRYFIELFPQDVRVQLHELIESLANASTPKTPRRIRLGQSFLRLTFSPLSSGAHEGTIVLVHDVTADTVRADELHRRNQELERRLQALQSIKDLSAHIDYPYGYPETLRAILYLISDLVQMEAAAALIQNNGECMIHIHLNQPVSQEAVEWIQLELIERHQENTQQTLDRNEVLIHFSGSAAISNLNPYKSFHSTIYIPLTTANSKGMIGCFTTGPQAFSDFDRKWLDMIVDLTSKSVISLKDLIDAERQKMQGVVESMVDGVLVADQSGEIVMINGAAKRMLHISRKEDTVTKKYLEESLGFYPFRLTTGLVQKPGTTATIQEEVRVFDKTLHSVLSPVCNVSGERTGTLVVLRDISEQKTQEERKSEFLSVISHELRTPLASIGGSVDLVLKNVLGQISDKQRRYLELAKDSCEKLNLVIDDLLDLSKFERGKMEIIMEPISLMNLVEEVVLKFQPFAMEKEITIKLDRVDRETSIYGDLNRLVQVMNNLLSNAIKFTPPAGEIEIGVFLPNGMPPHIGVSVKDTGPGIQVEDVERVFDKFEQVQRSNTRKVGGTGLGLAISRSIIEAHKGKIWVESRPGQGAKFIFLLPVEKRSAFASEVYADLTQPNIHEEISAVIMSEDPATSYLLKGILLERGFKASIPETLQEGLLLIRNQIPQLILVDLKPEESSRDLINILSHDPETTHIPVIVFSGRSIEDDEDWSSNVMVAKKPIEMHQFLQIMSQALARIRGGDLRKKIMVVDDDTALRMICREALEYQKYEVIEARDGARALEQLKRHKPDLILLDIMLPGIDGTKIAQIIKSNMATSHIPIIFLTAKDQTEDKVKALKAGGNDYLVKPFDSTELGARIEAILQRTEEELYSSPTTKLPGSVTIEREINRLITLQQKFALCYLDLDNLKSYNDIYGYAKADGVVRQIGDIIRETVLKLGTSSDFVGHVAGDDFVFITKPELADRICLSIIQRFDQIIPFFYKEQDRERGYIEAVDRYGDWRKFPVMSISIACLTNEETKVTDHIQIAALAADFKRMAKAVTGSAYIRNGKRIIGRGMREPKANA